MSRVGTLSHSFHTPIPQQWDYGVSGVVRAKSSDSRQRLAEAQRAWLSRVKSITGMTVTDLARAAGKHHTTLTNFMNKPARGPLNPLTIELVSQATGVPATMEARGTPAPAGSTDEAEPYVDSGDNPIAAAIKLFSAGNATIAAWRLRTHALENVGFLPGDIVLVDPDRQPAAGEAVCAEAYDGIKARTETVWRIYEPPYLMAATQDRSLSKPFLLDDRVRILGVVLPHRLRG